jgi:hypothetical protein
MPLNPVAYQTPDQIEAMLREREEALMLLPPAKVRQRVMLEITQMRANASMKRLLATRLDGDTQPRHSVAS